MSSMCCVRPKYFCFAWLLFVSNVEDMTGRSASKSCFKHDTWEIKLARSLYVLDRILRDSLVLLRSNVNDNGLLHQFL